jgi:hypothetical protein
MIASRAIMSMALAGVDLFAAIVFCGSSEGITHLRLFLLAAFVASLLLTHTLFCFYQAWQKRWDAVNLLVTAGFVPTLCLAGLTVTAISEIVRG